MMDVKTYTIRTHNPWLVFIAMILAMVLFSKSGIQSDGWNLMGLMFIVFCVTIFLIYHLLGKQVRVEISDSGISAMWQHSFFFQKIQKDIRWDEIRYIFISSRQIVDTLVITTRENKKYSLRCLEVFFNRQSQYISLLEDFQNRVNSYNIGKNEDDCITGNPSIFERPAGRITAIIILIMMIIATFFLIRNPLDKSDKLGWLKIITTYVSAIIFIGLAFSSHLKRNKK
jgi:hypothetical protein